MDYETSLKIGNAFGGGMGKMGETCGAVTGAVMVLSLAYGAGQENSRNTGEKAYDRAGEFIRKFRACHACISCRDLLGFDLASGEKPEKEKGKIISEKCPEYVRDAAEIIEQLLGR